MQITVRIDHRILRFEVSVDYWAFVEVLYGQYQTTNVELSCSAGANSYIRQKIEEVSSLDIVHQQIDEMCIFICLVQLDYEGVVNYLQDLFLRDEKLLHLMLQYNIFFNTFQCIHFFGLLILY